MFVKDSWHIIFGGENMMKDVIMSTVELYNWRTGEQCQLKDLPFQVTAHSGIVMDDLPVFCGGNSPPVGNQCFKLNKADQSWIKVGF